MNPVIATELYLAACRCAMLLSSSCGGAELEPVRADLCQLLPYLRQSLCCAVCDVTYHVSSPPPRQSLYRHLQHKADIAALEMVTY
uniref:uncharacterized protein isoform X4 n=1 Tax=Pristiophorus japonicus TaxID=55135 RepID=UPI00398EDBD2